MDGDVTLAPRGAPLVVPLADPRARAVAVAGGKAASLSALLGAGLPVPDGFCVTTAAYDRAAADADLGAAVAALAAEPAEGDGPVGSGAGAGAAADTTSAAQGRAPTTLRTAFAVPAAQARSRLRATPVPAATAAAVHAAYAALGPDVPVAVRSSATAEDLPEVSFAGQQDTFLGVVGAEAVLDAVRRCWASLWTDRAVAYRQANGIDHRAVGIAVVVQVMVEAAVSGVLFTANPLTGRRGETVVDAAPGLGEALVSGAVNPDQWVVDTATGEILRRTPGQRPGPAEDATPGLCLTDAQVRELTRLGARAEQGAGLPQDVEWAVGADGRIWVVQSRPITTLYPLPEPDADDGSRVYLCASLLQGITGPMTPMGLSVFDTMLVRYRPTAPGSAETFRYAHPGLRLYLDMTGSLRTTGGRAMFARAMRIADARSVAVIHRLMEDPRFAVTQGWTPRSLLGMYRSLPQLKALPQVAVALVRPAAATDRSRRAAQAAREAADLPDRARPEQRLDLVEQQLGPDLMMVVIDQVAPAVAAYIWFGVARGLLGPLARPGELPTVLQGLPNNVTTEMDLELWRTATLVREDPASAAALRDADPRVVARRYAEGSLPPVAQHALGDFLARYGHRAVAEIDLGVPRWADDPTHIVNVLANYLRLADPEQAPDRQFARAAREAEAMAAELTRRAERRGRLRGRVVGYGLRRARAAAGLREQPKFALVLVLAALRRQVAQVGAALAAAGRIATVEDVFFLDLAEARVGLRGADLHEVVAERRRVYERETRRRHVPRVLLSDGTDVEAAIAAEAAAAGGASPGTLSGAPASPGTVTGRARVVLEPAGARLEPGEILVAPSTDPGWTPLFLTAGALVMEMGGAMSHGAVVAREYGIPAVVGVPEATARIRTGDTVTVDGSAGTVTLGSGAP
ncbi:PEP/pyruvate-binding domain-containing protein [Georgenia ruanii]|uniref:Phosphoenolpyruvate synthase n=1 Tax=Georgenia ruanii TaxID=348442 RepID=A0A7J9V1P7_9MICO|nr:PEP/pyruvate-binding domain-containing protein [Georgenia ruanii]MPV90060.1 phosphoenolpyruvate synthase [Georgenia ruanii]